MKLNVKGIHCKSCVMLIEDSLSEIGVKITDSNPDKKIIQIVYDGDPKTMIEIKNRIKEEGYEVK